MDFEEYFYNLLQDYLNHRTRYVSFSNTNSEIRNLKSGVCQCSILGPLLFILYVNDLYIVSDKLNSILFADDTNVFPDGYDLSQLVD